MPFNSFTFAIFLPIVLVVYYRLSFRAQNVWLLLAGIVFYGWWDWRFLGLLGITTVLDFVASNRIYDSTAPQTKRLWLVASLTGNLTILGFFKYFNFFAASAQQALAGAGLHVEPWALHVVLPVGVSFYTFQEMAYTIDVYKGIIPPCRRLLDFALFVAYFPQLVAGPISRAKDLLPQLQQPRRVTGRHVREGAALIFIGLFKKVAVADAMATFVEPHFAQPGALSGASLLAALYLFTIQIYCDFSGYSDVARGVSKLLGIELMVNFRQPYFSRSITEFWRRWHISLSTWLREYLYIPLGGNRHGRFNTYRNLLLTMLIGGLWHGANWTFVMWGALHGSALAVHKWLVERRGEPRTDRMLVAIVKGVVTFHFVCLTWIFFRANTIASAWEYLIRILTWSSGNMVFGNFDALRFAMLIACLLLIDIGGAWPETPLRTWLRRPAFRGLAYGTAMVVWLMLGGVDAQVPFIYFQF